MKWKRVCDILNLGLGFKMSQTLFHFIFTTSSLIEGKPKYEIESYTVRLVYNQGELDLNIVMEHDWKMLDLGIL